MQLLYSLFGCVYRFPVNDIMYLDNIINCIKCVCHKYTNHKIVITGNLNFPNINWNLDVPHSVNNFGLKFVKCIMDYNLFQLVRQATRNNNILNLVIVTDNDNLIHLTIVLKLIASDHECLQISLVLYMSSDFISRPI